MNIVDLELHDAVLLDMHVEFKVAQLMLDIDAYLSTDASTRESIKIVFHGVEKLSHISNLLRLKEHAGPGNINYWVPCLEKGETYIYLSDGCFAVFAESVSVSLRA